MRLLRSELLHAWPTTAVVGLLLSLPLILNPGWYSHDELQWAAQALPLDDTPGYVGWLDWQRFQYRPLTFQLWLWLSRALFETPMLYHAVHAGAGVLVALALQGVLGLHGWPRARAQLAALMFLMHPYAVYVHGWVATLADVLWVGAGLGMAALLCARAAERLALATRLCLLCALTVLALLAKESALSLCALIAVWALWQRGRENLLATLAVALPTVLYLALRLPVILSRPDDVTYGWSPLWPPLRLAQYFVFPLALDVREVQVLALRPLAFALAGTGTLLMLGLTIRAQRALGLLWLVAGAAALGPVLLLASAASQYGYALAMLSATVWAAAQARLQGTGRRLLLVAVCLVCAHGLQGAWRMQTAGRLSANFLADSAQALHANPDSILKLSLAQARQPWLYQRLTHEVPHYAGVPMLDRIQLQDTDEGADYRVLRDGRLEPVEASQGR